MIPNVINTGGKSSFDYDLSLTQIPDNIITIINACFAMRSKKEFCLSG